MANAKMDENSRNTLTALSNADGISIVALYADPVTHRLLVDATNISTLTTKGDIFVYSTINTRLPVGTDGQVLSADSTQATGLKWVAVAGTGTVTSVSWTGGIVSVATATTTPAFTIAGTSGGIPYFSSASTWATSAALAANALVIGGGAGVAPSTITTGTGIVTALGINVGSAGAPVLFNGALGTPSSGTLTNATGLPISTGVSGLGTGIATALAVNTGSAGAPVLFNGALGTPSSGTATNLSGTAASLTAGAVTNATLTTALTVNTGTVTLTGNVANTSVLTIGAGASSISGTSSGSNTGDQTITLTGAVTGTGTGSFATTIATPGTLTSTSTNSTATAHTHAITSSANPGAAASLLATDANGGLGVVNLVEGWTTTATAAGTTTMTITSTYQQYWTGSSTQTVKLPTTSVVAGQQYNISNNSTGSVTVQSSGANTIIILGAGQSAIFTALVATPTTAANWNFQVTDYIGLNIAQTASANAATVNLAYKTNTITNNSAATLTVTIPTAGAVDGETRIVRIFPSSAVAQTLTLVNTENSTVSAPVSTGASTTVPIQIGFIFNNATTKWTVIASA